MRKKLFTFLLALATSVGLSWAQNPSGSCGTNLSWEFNPATGTLTITGSGAMTDWANATSRPWHSYQSDITSLSLPEGLTFIGRSAFQECQMTSVELPNSLLEIGRAAFCACGLTSVTIPDNVQTIGQSAFASCQNLSTITIGSGVTSIGYFAFSNLMIEPWPSRKLESVTCYATNPPTCGYDESFSELWNKEQVPLYVPAESVAAYSAAEDWNGFDVQAISGGSAPTGNSITINESSHGSVVASSSSAAAGETITLTATPDDGYQLKSISGVYETQATSSETLNATSETVNGNKFQAQATSRNNYGWRVYNPGTANTLTVSSKDGATLIEKIEFTSTWGNGRTNNMLSVSAGTLSFDENVPSTTVTINGINATSVTISGSGTNAGQTWCISSVKVYYEGTDEVELEISDTENANVKTFTMVDGEVTISAEFEPASTPTPSATSGIFAYNYDCQRDPAFPTKSESCELSGFDWPMVGNNSSIGPWKIEFVEYYNSSSTEYDFSIDSDLADLYGKTPEQMEIYRLYQWNESAGEYQHAAYGVLCAYANESNPVEHAALFVADGRWGCYLTGEVHDGGSINITFDEDASTGFADLHGGSTPTPSGDKLPGVFSISSTKTVNFSKGNLQYVGGAWQFAENQWDVIGASQADNNRDLFGWGTGNNPNQTSMQYGDYTTFADWGSNMGGDWRTLTYDEWSYIFYTRTSASDLRGSATVCGVHGYIILPDNFVLPGGLSWTPRPNDWTTNVYTSQEWSSMEENGAVFLPAAGYRASTTVIYDESSWGYYWSATEHSQAYNAYNVWVAEEDNDVKVYFRSRTFGQSVRLVSEATPAPAPTDEQVPTNADPENPSYHYSTFFHSTQNYKLTNDGTTAFIADLSGNDLVLTEIAHGEQVIPANTAVILRKTGSADPVVLTPTEENGVSVNPDDNSLEGVDAVTAVTSIDGLTTTNCYVLSGTAQYGVGFYKISGNTLKAHKAYVIYYGGQNNAPKKMRFVFNTTTGVESAQPSAISSQKVLENGVLYIIKNGMKYNVQGQIIK